MSNRTALQNAIIDYVAGMEGAGNVIDVNAAAVKLSSAYPQSGLTIDSAKWPDHRRDLPAHRGSSRQERCGAAQRHENQELAESGLTGALYRPAIAHENGAPPSSLSSVPAALLWP